MPSCLARRKRHANIPCKVETQTLNRRRRGSLLGVPDMPIRYERDDARQRIRVTLTDPLTEAEITSAIDRQAAEGTWRYGLLYDARAINSRAAAAMSRVALNRVRAVVEREGRRGPVAIVANATLVGISEAYAIESHKAGRTVQVFWSLDEANQWLDQQLQAL